MSSHQHQYQQPSHTVIDIELPATLDSAGAKLVFLYLAYEEEATIDELHRALRMKKLTLYSVLETVTATDLVERTETTYVSHQQTGGEGGGTP